MFRIPGLTMAEGILQFSFPYKLKRPNLPVRISGRGRPGGRRGGRLGGSRPEAPSGRGGATAASTPTARGGGAGDRGAGVDGGAIDGRADSVHSLAPSTFPSLRCGRLVELRARPA